MLTNLFANSKKIEVYKSHTGKYLKFNLLALELKLLHIVSLVSLQKQLILKEEAVN